MIGTEITLEVKVTLDSVPGKFHQPEDFVELIERWIPEWYLKSVRISAVGDVPISEAQQ